MGGAGGVGAGQATSVSWLVPASRRRRASKGSPRIRGSEGSCGSGRRRGRFPGAAETGGQGRQRARHGPRRQGDRLARGLRLRIGVHSGRPRRGVRGRPARSSTRCGGDGRTTSGGQARTGLVVPLSMRRAPTGRSGGAGPWGKKVRPAGRVAARTVNSAPSKHFHQRNERMVECHNRGSACIRSIVFRIQVCVGGRSPTGGEAISTAWRQEADSRFPPGARGLSQARRTPPRFPFTGPHPGRWRAGTMHEGTTHDRGQQHGLPAGARRNGDHVEIPASRGTLFSGASVIPMSPTTGHVKRGRRLTSAGRWGARSRRPVVGLRRASRRRRTDTSW